MSIITISRGSYSRGKEIAEKLATKLDYECVSREIVLETCAEFNIPEIKLTRMLHDASTVLERFQHGKERYLSYYRYALLKHLMKDNVVYHGLAGHYFLRNIAHVLKVRIIANIDDRVQEEMKRGNSSREDALYLLKKDDEERRKWGLQIYGTDTWDSRLYDMVLHIDTISVEDAVEILFDVAQKPAFKVSEESQQTLEEMAKLAEIHAKVIRVTADFNVHLTGRTVFISNIPEGLEDRIEKLALEVDNIDEVVVQKSRPSKPGYINPYHNI